MKPKLPTSWQGACGALALACGAASAQAPAKAPAAPAQEYSRTGAPTSWIVRGEPYDNPGYGNARWGMSKDEVRAVLARDFPQALSTLREQDDPVTRSTALGLTVAALPPGPGPAALSYVFGAASGRLVAVHLSWGVEGEPGAAARQQVLHAATLLAGELVGYQWPVFGTTRGALQGPGAFILFAGRTPNGGAVEIRVEGVALAVEQPHGQPPQQRPAPSGPARLRQSFVANVDHPDIYQIPAGAF
ncbi:hypothetical protein ACLB1G_12850 [Oxalobacteraceae bacterium A2-2]